jgi:hypothetical protein
MQNHGHKVAAGATVFRDTLISVNSVACSCDVIREVPCTPAMLFVAAFHPLLLHVFM